MAIPNHPNSRVDATVPPSGTAQTGPVRTNFFRMKQEIEALQHDLTTLATRTGARGPTGAAGATGITGGTGAVGGAGSAGTMGQKGANGGAGAGANLVICGIYPNAVAANADGPWVTGELVVFTGDAPVFRLRMRSLAGGWSRIWPKDQGPADII